MNPGYNDAVAIRRELRNAKRILSNPDKFSASLLELAWKAKESAEKFHGIYLHQKLFQETCVAYGALVPFPASTHQVDS